MRLVESHSTQEGKKERATCCPWSHGLRPKKLKASVAVPPSPVRVPSKKPLATSIMSVASVGNDMILGAVHRSLVFSLQLRETPETSGRSLSDGLATGHHHKWGPLLLNEVSRIVHYRRKREGRNFCKI